MTNDRNQAANIRFKTVEKRNIQRLVILFIAVFIISTTIYIFFRTPIGQNITSPPNYETFNSQLEPLKTSLNIVGIGDSLTKGVGDLNEKGYAGLTAEALKKSVSVSDVNLVDYGVKGDTTDDLLRVLEKKEVQNSIKNADMVFMTIGGNDIVGVLRENFLGLKLNDFKEKRLVFQRNFNQILQTIYQLNPKASVYYIGLYNPFEDLMPDLDPQFQAILQQWNNSSETILELYPHTFFIPTADIFKDKSNELLYKDHFHPNKKGYQLISNRLVSLIENKK